MTIPKLSYSEPEDRLFLTLSDEEPAHTVAVNSNVTAWVNDNGGVIALGISDAAIFLRDAFLEDAQARLEEFALREDEFDSIPSEAQSVSALSGLSRGSVPYSDSSVSTTGSGPFEIQEFDELLREKGLKVWGIDPDDTAVLIVGRKDYEEEKILKLLDGRAGKNLKVYSQEMFLTYWMTGSDPFEDESLARQFGAGHPALEFLSTQSFDWPGTVVYFGRGGFTLPDGHDGLLSQMGYKVGIRGLDESKRKQILREIYASRKLPPVHSPSYMSEWGGPNSKERLLKLANTLATLSSNAKSQPRMIQAASDWEHDLEWLRKTYHHGKFAFRWPSIYVQ